MTLFKVRLKSSLFANNFETHVRADLLKRQEKETELEFFINSTRINQNFHHTHEIYAQINFLKSHDYKI